MALAELNHGDQGTRDGCEVVGAIGEGLATCWAGEDRLDRCVDRRRCGSTDPGPRQFGEHRRAPVAGPAASGPRAPLTRYSLVNGCYALRSPTGHADRGRRGTVSHAGGGAWHLSAVRADRRLPVEPAAGALRARARRAPPRSGRSTAARRRGSRSPIWRPAPSCPSTSCAATGCAPTRRPASTPPARRSPAPAPRPTCSARSKGHAHVTAFELFGGDFHCGRPWSPFGAPYALPASCAADEQGTNGEFEALLDFGGATRPATCTAGRRSSTGRARRRWPRRATTTRASSGPGRPGCG